MKNIINILGVLSLLISIGFSAFFYIQKEATIKEEQDLLVIIEEKQNQYNNLEEEVRKIQLLQTKTLDTIKWSEVLKSVFEIEKETNTFLVFDTIRIDESMEIFLSGRTNNFELLSSSLQEMNDKNNIFEKGTVFLTQHSKEDVGNIYIFDISAIYILNEDEDNE